MKAKIECRGCSNTLRVFTFTDDIPDKILNQKYHCFKCDRFVDGIEFNGIVTIKA